MSEGFSLEWLRLREPADRRARSRALARRFAEAVRAQAGDETAVVLDLGAGTGANFRALAPLIGSAQDWRLIDRDPALLAQQPAEIAQWGRAQGYRVAHGSGIATVAAASEWRAYAVPLDLASLDRLPFAGVHGVTCSALLDLVSSEWLRALAQRLAEARLPFLAALNSDGRREWQPAHEADATVAAAFARHHGGDKGFGPALGARAADAAAAQLRAEGHMVECEASDWRLGAEDAAMLEMLVEGTAAAVSEAAPDSETAVAQWRETRLEQCREGVLRVLVGHTDVLAIPQGKRS